jgi:hypothetical protein
MPTMVPFSTPPTRPTLLGEYTFPEPLEVHPTETKRETRRAEVMSILKFMIELG